MVNKCSEGLGGGRFCMHFPYNSFIKDYAEVFYMIHDGYVPSIQWKTNLDWL